MTGSLRAFAAIVLAEILSYGAFAGRLGFYSDDWVFINLCANAPGFWARLKDVAAAASAGFRPLSVFLYPIAYALAGARPWAYHMLLSLQDVVGAFLLFLFLRGLLESEGLALAAAVLSLLYPIAPAVHLWFGDGLQGEAQILLLLSLLAHQRWLAGRGRRWLAAGLAAYLGGLLCYEGVALMPLLLGGGLLGRVRLAGASWRASVVEAGTGLAPYGWAFAAGMAWQRLAVPMLFHMDNPKTFSVSIGFIAAAFSTPSIV